LQEKYLDSRQSNLEFGIWNLEPPRTVSSM
jgi:hypothetical protein